jgi:uncharacterized protein YdhG (YjbR/CyaY superfamily)
MVKTAVPDVDAYIAAAPRAAQAKLKQLRSVIKASAPKAVEKISYAMPYYDYHGRLVYFAGYNGHVAVYMVGKAKQTYAKEIDKYKTAKATLRVPLDQPLPVALIKKLVRARAKELEGEQPK